MANKKQQLTFHSTTTIEFSDAESLEAFVRQMPWPPHKAIDLLEGKEVVDEDDSVDATGAGKVVHIFKITGEE
jgi:hypothetical protein